MWLRSLALLALGATVGPWLAAAAYFLFYSLVQYGLLGVSRVDWGFFFGGLPMLWLIPLQASVVTGLCNAVIGHLVARESVRLLLAAAIGAAVFIFDLNWVVQSNAAGDVHPVGVAVLGAAGAFASVVQVALVDAFGRRRQTG